VLLKFMMVLRTLLMYCMVGVIGLVCAGPCLLVATLPERWRHSNRLYLWFADIFYRGVVFATMLPVKVVGRHNLDAECAIVVANHQSALDIPVVGGLLGRHPHVWLVLKYYAKVPVFGFLIRRMALIVDQESSASRSRSVLCALRYARDCSGHIIVFPEGGRYLEVRPKRFMNGFAMLASKTKLPVIPVYLEDFGAIYPPYAFWIKYAPIRVVVGEPMVMLKDESAADFGQRVYDWYMQHTNS
jgi:1-acyl-sn-glycerol-3-phosphate acyltransferase